MESCWGERSVITPAAGTWRICPPAIGIQQSPALAALVGFRASLPALGHRAEELLREAWDEVL